LKPDRLTARRLLGRVPELPTAPDAGPFVGRARELAAVIDLFEEVVERGRPRLVQISGAAGIGKSRLAREFAAALRDRYPAALVWRGRCLPARRASAYGALAEVVRELGEVGLSDKPENAWHRLVSRVAALVPGADRADVAELAFALATTASIAAPRNPLESLSPEAVGEQLGVAWPRFLSGCAAVRPLVIVVEDLHWASEALLAILERIALRSTGPLMLVATARPELVHPHSGPGMASEGATGISLQPLTDTQSRELLDGLPLVRSLTPDLRERVVERAEGNPFFLEELHYHVAGQAATTVPDSLYSLLAARIDALEPGPLSVLQVAAVVGRTFWAEAVERSAPFEPVRPTLDGLEAEGFIVRQPRASLPGVAELAFRHALLHDVAYESVPRTIRARLHAGVAEWMEAAAPGRRDEIEEVLAGHWASAAAADVADVAWPGSERREEVRLLAFQHLVRAGQLARGRFAIAGAIDSHERALSLAATVDERMRAHEELGDDHAATYHGDAARVAYEQALREARADSSRGAVRAHLCRKLAWMMAFNPGAFRVNPDPADVEALIAEGQVTVGDAADRAWLLLAEGACARLYRGSEPFGQGTRGDIRPIEERIAAAEHGLRMGEALGLEELVNSGRRGWECSMASPAGTPRRSGSGEGRSMSCKRPPPA
jgi:predicted ATPase